jgi:L-malate glycosyltransferase
MNAPCVREHAGVAPKKETGLRPIRVLHFTAVEVDNYYLNNLVDHGDRSRVEYCFATTAPEGSFVRRMRERGVRAEAFGCASRAHLPRAARILASMIRQERVDIVHGHLFDPTLVAAVVSRLMGKPLVTTRHHSDFIHTLQPPLKRRIYLSLETFVNRTARHIIAPALMVRKVLVEHEGVSPGRITVIPYGQKAERFDSVSRELIAKTRAELGMGPGLSLVCVSRLSPEKGHRFLLEALDGLRKHGVDATLFLVGPGPLESEIRGQASRLGLEGRVRFLGWRDDALAIIGAADIVVHSSLQEALPSAVIEALMMARPLVATDVSGVADVMGGGEHGFVVPPADSGALRDGIEKTAADLDGARRRASRGREFVLIYMDARRVASQYEDCYVQVAGSSIGDRGAGGRAR